VHEHPGEGLGEDGRISEVHVVAEPLAGQQRMQGVVEVVAPLRGHPHPARADRLDHPRVVEVGLGDEAKRPAEFLRERGSLRRQLLEEMRRAVVDQRVDGVQPQRVEMEVPEPAQCVVTDPAPYLGAAGVVQVDRRSPGRGVLVGEVGTEAGQVVATRSEVVVDDVEADGQSRIVTAVDEPLQCFRAAVRVMDGVEVHAVVPPAVDPGERGHRKERDHLDTQHGQVVQVLAGGVQRAFRRERPDVQLVEHRAVHVPAGPVVVGPLETVRIEHPAEATDSIRLPGAARVG